MVIVSSYPLAVILCFITMLCWGSWANTRKLAAKEWSFQLFYWDYALGVLLISLLLGISLGSTGSAGRPMLTDITQAGTAAIWSAILGGAVFNLSNILLVAAIDIAGMSVAFPIGVGIALVLGVVTNYIGSPLGNPLVLFIGLAFVVAAILLDAMAYSRLGAGGASPTRRGILISVAAGVLMGFFYRFVAASMSTDPIVLEAGKLSPYSAVLFFAIGLFVSNFIWNTYAMRRPLWGEPVQFRDYLEKGTPRLHAVGILGGAIWGLGMALSLIASGTAGFAISYGLGQGATMVAAIWGVFIWKEFQHAETDTRRLLAFMFLCYMTGLGLIIVARFV